MADRVSQIASHLNHPKGLLAGQVAIITGSGQGIGAEAARLFANEGAKVVVADIDASTHPLSSYEHDMKADPPSRKMRRRNSRHQQQRRPSHQRSG
jgi:3-oxoacyl-[acyl-carrier protein] reductase